MNKKTLSAYMARIGSKGGKISRRELSPEQAREMAKRSHAARKNNTKGKNTR